MYITFVFAPMLTSLVFGVVGIVVYALDPSYLLEHDLFYSWWLWWVVNAIAIGIAMWLFNQVNDYLVKDDEQI